MLAEAEASVRVTSNLQNNQLCLDKDCLKKPLNSKGISNGLGILVIAVTV